MLSVFADKVSPEEFIRFFASEELRELVMLLYRSIFVAVKENVKWVRISGKTVWIVFHAEGRRVLQSDPPYTWGWGVERSRESDMAALKPTCPAWLHHLLLSC